MQTVFISLQTLGIGALGAVLAMWLGIPAAHILGPAALVSIAGLSGMRTAMPKQLRMICFVIIGMGMGSGVTPEVVAAAIRWPLSLVFLVGAMALTLWAGSFALRASLGLSPKTSVLAAAPGHLSYVLSLGLETGKSADMKSITLIQSLRVLALTLLTPPLVILLRGEPLPSSLPPVVPMPVLALMGLTLAGLVVGYGLDRLKVPAALLIGAMFASSFAHGAGIIHGGVPRWLAMPGFVVMGCVIGTRFDGVKLRDLRKAFAGAMLLTGIAVVISCLAAWAVAEILGFSLTSALIAFAPGGLETMMAMALLLDAEPAYVALHHVGRIFTLTVLIPVFLHAAPENRDP
ncbi:MAG: AbrB family transcriptional regulator [Mangrovicoccus sp.]